ncbi:MAG TPA: AI-2E family transporter [Candidatus Polarisedimenticolia bacterium]|jgi:predicted PurR-regulated permease PerM|nr:AI-2E family transporter [Candidatus Polarisedimenticolia bacterium]
MKADPSRLAALAMVVFLATLLVVGLKPYLNFILAALVFGPLFRPVHLRILRRLKRPSLAAILTLAVIVALVILPLAGLGTMAFQEAKTIADQYRNLPPEARDMMLFGKKIPELLRTGAERITAWVQSSLGSIFSETIRMVVGFFIMFYLIYYLLLEQESLGRVTTELLPFQEKNSKRLIEEFNRMTRGFVIGQGITAALQGALGGIGFLIFGFPGAFLWGLVMGILSLVPVLGAFLIWIPAGILQIAGGSTFSGVGILAWGALVVSTADNFIRPVLMKNMIGVHPVITLLGVFAGLSLFGLIGIVIGPLLFAMVLETARMFYREQQEPA